MHSEGETLQCVALMFVVFVNFYCECWGKSYYLERRLYCMLGVRCCMSVLCVIHTITLSKIPNTLFQVCRVCLSLITSLHRNPVNCRSFYQSILSPDWYLRLSTTVWRFSTFWCPRTDLHYTKISWTSLAVGGWSISNFISSTVSIFFWWKVVIYILKKKKQKIYCLLY